MKEEFANQYAKEFYCEHSAKGF